MISTKKPFGFRLSAGKQLSFLHHGTRLLLTVFCLLAFVSTSTAGLKIYYIRHAEGGHNVKKEYANLPKETWPDYVGNGDVFTPKGRMQAIAAVDKLDKYHFDFIGVSSMWRTRNTVLPYLKASGAKGEIWPELHEFGGGLMVLSTNLPAPTDQILGAGPAIELPAEEAPFFTLRPDAKNDFKVPAKSGEKREAAVQFIVRRVAAMVHQRFGGTDKTILLVGHGTCGKTLLRLLLNDDLKDYPSMTNTGIWMVEEQPDGKFKLKMYNDVPCGNDRLASLKTP